MNRRIKKKKQKLSAMHTSKWKDAKLCKKKVHVLNVKTRQRMWEIMPRNNNYTMYLLRRRRCGKLESKITRHVLSSKMLIITADERKEVKKKLFSKEGNCNE